jgi:thiosulfate/3-mercaptopyruvate sulfurtransferase
VRDLEAVRANLGGGAAQVLDARSAGRFAGTEPEPRPGLRGGHIPGSLSLPFQRLYAADGTLLPRPSLRDVFAKAGVALERSTITLCGSGVTAAALALGLYQLGRADVAVYDGSWTEWGGRADTPIER